MNTIVSKFRNKRGSATVSGSCVILIISMVLSLILTVAPVLDKISTVDRMSHQVARYVEVRGDTSSAHTEFNRLKDEYKIHPSTMSIEANTIGNSTRIQLEEEFTVSVTFDTHIGIGSIIKRPFSITRKATGRSEHYWKE